MKCVDYYKIDGKKLEKALRELGVTKAGASRDIGRSDSYISNCIYEGRVSRATKIALEAVFGIGLDSYELADDAALAETENLVPVFNDEFFETLHSVVYEAMLAALRKNAEETLGRRFS